MGITFLRKSIDDWKERKEECAAMQLETSHIVNKEYWKNHEAIADKYIANLESQLAEMMENQDPADIS